MHAIDITASFWAVDPDTGEPLRNARPTDLLAAIGEDGHVEHNASRGTVHARLTTTAEGSTVEHARAALDRLDRLAGQAGLDQPFEYAIRVEELVAIAGHHHRRGEFVT